MKLFLKKDVDNLGSLGDVIEVKTGFARNYLIPHGFGVEVGQANKQWIEAQKRRLEVHEEQRLAGLKSLADSVDGCSCTLIARATEEGHLFGSVSDQDIADQLLADGIELDPACLELEKPIKELGIYNLIARIHPEMESTIKVWVVKADDEADDSPEDAPARA
ncbi:MAG: 50S ribosomal protein L9 [Planctomycetota bacterium]|jgi:large subunit ribosomal protein L9